MRSQLLIIFYRNPELGKVKSRLAATLGDERALAIYLKMAAHTRWIASCIEVDRVVYYSEYADTEDNWLNEIFSKSVQLGADLGDKMSHAFEMAFRKGYKSVCIIGTDCLELTHNILAQAFDSLTTHEVVLGPAKDGGYYLLGMNAFHPELFKNKRWSTNSVYDDTRNDILKLGVSNFILPMLADVDVAEDLPDTLR